ncbi:hypothetical protein FRB95_012524 [Tulasnella sp. JGI-2019a]|nr:hypothetical protein FRB95_012524 [Tulasnella sp. JGI-2019a]
MSIQESPRSSLAEVSSSGLALHHHTDADDITGGSPEPAMTTTRLSSKDAALDSHNESAPKRRGTSEAASVGSRHSSVTPLPSPSVASPPSPRRSISTLDDPNERPRPAYIRPLAPSSLSHSNRIRVAQSLPNLHASGGSSAGSDSGETNDNRRPNATHLPVRNTGTGTNPNARYLNPRRRSGSSSIVIEEVEETPATPRRNIFQQIGRIFTSDGREQRKRAGILARLAFNLTQIILIIIFLALSASVWKSEKDPTLTEWKACDRPLGVWNALWAARITLGLLLGVWEWKRQRDRTRRTQTRNRDAEESGAEASHSSTIRPDSPQPRDRLRHHRTQHQQRTSSFPDPSANTARPSISEAPAAVASMMVSQISPNTPMAGNVAAEATTRGTSSLHITPGTPTFASSDQDADRRARRERRERQRRRAAEAATVPVPTPNPPTPPGSNALFDRFETCLTVLALAHFVGNNILLFSSVYTCRFTSPHVWWLGLAIACLSYVVVVEVILIAIVIFVLGPILLLTLNLLMLCLGREYDRGNPTIRAEIPKLDQKWVDQIPLVVYIPPKSDEVDDEDGEEGKEATTPAHTYPPKAPEASAAGPSEPVASSSSSNAIATPEAGPKRVGKGRFLFLRRKPAGEATSSSTDANPPASSSTSTVIEKANPSKSPKSPTSSSKREAKTAAVVEEDPWEARFERGEHPFVMLDGNRAACAICLCDFIEPKRRGEEGQDLGNSKLNSDPRASGDSDLEKGKSPDQGEGDEGSKKKKTKKAKTKLAKDTIDDEQAGIPGEPLRLLTCGHVFHRTCLDPWLLDVSGRCPVCQAAVEVTGKDGDHA